MSEIENQRRIEEMMLGLGKAVGEVVEPLGLGFALIVFEFYEPGVGHYISNAERESMIKALRETAKREDKNGRNQAEYSGSIYPDRGSLFVIWFLYQCE